VHEERQAADDATVPETDREKDNFAASCSINWQNRSALISSFGSFEF
jgi:hypothetical protein